jgi:predicted MFS family arabinose efflux permease
LAAEQLTDDRADTIATGLTLGTIGVLGVITGSVVLTSLGGALIGLVAFITPPLMTTALLRRKVPHDMYAACLSIATAFFAIGQIIGPLFGGWIVDRFSLQFGLTSSATFIGISAVLACMYGGIQQRLEKRNLLVKDHA